MKTHHILPILLAVTLTSCVVQSRVETARSLDIYGPGVIHTPVIADLDVRENKVTGTATGHRSEPAAIKHSALADALRKAQADILVEPSYVLETSGNRTTATVTGFPANYKNFRQAVAADSTLIRAGHMHRAQQLVPEEAPTKRKGGGVLAAIVSTVVIGLTIFLLSGM